ncbi:zinc-dependent metalloprotease [Pyxidicoccus trucidator]|uniref:zinc-dependent metalloprotease n=1 Tax=Pyxidicoccus trucidator TaxID=2709662 RepID=UPI0013DD24EF|nr:zinc-dependent metalloprotease [Pyxidicoccus trucidator]
MRRSLLGAASLAVALSTGCGSPTSSPASEVPEAPAEVLPVTLDETFVAVPKEVGAARKQQVEQKLQGAVDDSGTSFYLAIRRSELGQKWFMSAFLKQHHPGGILYYAASTLGTRVVSFKEQNGKLFVLDVDDTKVLSDVFDPEVLVEAYPVVTDHGPFNRARGSDQYVLIDPTAGLNRFGVLGDLHGRQNIRFQVELSFAQRFRRMADGVAFEQVFTGYMDVPDDLSHGFLEANPYRRSGTLGLTLRKYSESAGYTPTPPPPKDFYIQGAERLIPNSGGWTELAVAKWNIHPGMKPIRWHITDSILTVQDDPFFSEYDVVGAVKRGIEGWNAAFGFKVLEAVVADSSLNFADDDKNVLIFDTDLAMPLAFASLRTNPNTGEIRGASIYAPAAWMANAIYEAGGEGAAPTLAADPLQALRMSWSGMRDDTLCDLSLARVLEGEGAPVHVSADDSLTPKQKAENALTNLVLHEIGHTLGLRHNFSGTRVYDGGDSVLRSSTVMDYPEFDDAIHGTQPGPYDVQAVRYLYGLSEQLPTQAFCTDPDRRLDPYCSPNDRFDEPLTKWFVPQLHAYLAPLLRNSVNLDRQKGLFGLYVNDVLKFVRAGNAQAQVTAYQGALAQVRPPLHVPADAPPQYAARADELARRLLSRLYLDPVADRGFFSANPPATSALLPLVIADVKAILLNADGVRTYGSRRVMVDILKTQQTLASYSALRNAQETLTAQLPALSGDARLEAEDLVARISEAVSPYYR